MAIPVIMPRQGQSVESCIVTKWHKNVGDEVKVGEILFSYETDKASFDEEAKDAGVLLARFFEEGDDVPCLTNMCVLGKTGEDVSAFAPGGASAEAAPAAEVKAETAPEAAAAFVAAVPVSGDLKISPRAKALAERAGADLSFAQASGPDGRVIARDVQALLDAGKRVTKAAQDAYAGGIAGSGIGGKVVLSDLAPKAAPAAPAAVAAPAEKTAEAETYTEPLTNIRKVIAKAMMTSLSSMAQLTHNSTFDATCIQNLRKLFKEKGADAGMDKITLNDVILYAVSRVLSRPEYRMLNANLNGDTMTYFNHVNLGVAVDTDRGLMVPTIFHAETKSLKEISAEAKKLANDCKAGSISPDLLKGGSFTVSNVGSYGVESFTPVINPPQTGILGVGTIVTRVRDVNGAAVPYPAMGLSLTYDHRALDGGPASRFLRDLGKALEQFTLLLVEG